MRIERVEYRQLKSTGNFENETFGATAFVEEGEVAGVVLEKLKEFVQEFFAESDRKREGEYYDENERARRRQELDQLNSSLEYARETWSFSQSTGSPMIDTKTCPSEETVMPTPWAPSQHKGMSCCCHWPDAQQCSDSRYGRLSPYHHDYDTAFEDRENACDCSCHDRDWEDEDDEY